MIKWRKTKFAIWLGFFIMLILAFNFVNASNTLVIPINATSQTSQINITSTDLFKDARLLMTNPNVVLFYPLDHNNDSNAKTEDYSIYNNTGNLTNNPIFNTSGYIGNDYKFNGLSNFIDIPYSTSLNTSGSITMGAWVNPQVINAKRYIISKYSDNGSIGVMNGTALSLNTGKPLFELTLTNNTLITLQSNITFTINTWHYVLGTYNGSNMYLYVDGVAVNNTNKSLGLRTDNNTFRVGYAWNGNATKYFNGSIDQILVMNSSINSSDVTQLYNTQFSRFYGSGQQLYNNLNLSLNGRENFANVTFGNCQTFNSTSLQFALGYSSGGNYIYQPFQTMVNCDYDNYNFTENQANNISLKILFNSNALNFYSPLLMDNITINSMVNLDITPPNATINIPANNTFTNTTNITFSVNATDNINLSQSQLYIYNTSGFLVNQTNTTLTGTSNQDNIVVNLYEGIFNFFYKIIDTSGNIFTTVTNTFTIDNSHPTIILSYPLNATNYTTNVVTINYSVSDTNLNACFFGNSTSYVIINCSGTPYTTSAQQGFNTWNLSANDSAGNFNTKSVTFYMDTISPNATILTPINNFNTNYSIVNFSMSGADNLNLSKVEFYVYNPNPYLDINYSISGTSIYIANPQSLADGTYTYFYEIEDSLGNRGLSSNQTVTIDSTQPSFNSIPNNVSLIYQQQVAVQFNITDLHLNTISTNDSRFSFNSSQTLINTTTLGINNYTIKLTATDTFGNTKIINYLVSVTVGSPSLSILFTPSQSVLYNSSLIVTGINCPSTLNCTLYKNLVLISNPFTYNVPFNNDSFLYSTAGNQNYSAFNYTANITVFDNLNPNATINTPINNTYTNNTNLNFSVNASDNYNLSQAELYIYNSTGYLVVITNYSISGNTAQTSSLHNLYEGVFHFFYTIYDTVGNSFTTITNYFIIDLTKPFIQIYYPLNATNYSSQITYINFSTQDNSMDTCKFSNSTSTIILNCSNPIYSTSAQQGYNTWSIWANDSAGNSNYKNNTFFMDTINPIGSNPVKNVTTVYSGDTVLFSANWTDNLNLANYVFSINQTGDYINYGFIPFTFDNISRASILINASAGTVVHWSFTGYDSVGNSNATITQSFVVSTLPTNLNVQTSKTIYEQGYSNSSTYPYLVDISANYTNIYNQELINASCILMANQKVIQTNLLFNSSSGLFQTQYPTNNLYGNVVLDVNCSYPNAQSQLNEKNISVYYMMFANENENLTFDNSLSTSTYLTRDMPTTNDVYNLQKIVPVNNNSLILVQEFNYHAIGVNGSFQRDYYNDGDFNLSTNMSLSDTVSCQPILCYFIKDYTFNKVYEDCGDTSQIYNLSSGVATQLNYNIVDEHTLATGTFFGQSIYLNCTNATTETINFYYNYSNEIPAISLSNAKPSSITSRLIASSQTENNYTITSNQNISEIRNSSVLFNNTGNINESIIYTFFTSIPINYPNSIIPNTVYIYNSFGQLWASDNVSALAPNVATLFGKGNDILWQTEIIPSHSLVVEKGNANIKDIVRDTENLTINTANLKTWEVNVKTISMTNNLYVTSNYSQYANDSYSFNVIKIINGVSTDISSQIIVDNINKLILFPVINLSANISYIVNAYNNLPLIQYVNPTPINSSSLSSYIPVNITTLDVNNFTTSIYLYNSSFGLIDQVNSSNANFYYEFMNFTNGQYSFNISSCDILASCKVLPLRTINFDNNLVEKLKLTLGIVQYPYLSVNKSYSLDVSLKVNNDNVNNGNVTMKVYAPTGTNTSFTLLYNSSSGTYQNSILFTQAGDYGFLINANAVNIGQINSSGIFYVREPFEIDVQLYNQADQTLIKNDFAYITAEYVGTQKVSPVLENFVQPFRTNIPATFHAQYINGLANITLYDPSNYIFRYIDGKITFNGQYSPPNITKTYTANTYLGTEKLNGTSSLVQFVLSTEDLHPYRTLFNWTYVFLIVGAIIVTLFLFFTVPEYAVVSFFLGVGFIIMLTLLRVIIWFWLGS